MFVTRTSAVVVSPAASTAVGEFGRSGYAETGWAASETVPVNDWPSTVPATGLVASSTIRQRPAAGWLA